MNTARLFWEFRNVDDPEVADVYLFGVIGADGFWEEGVSSDDFVRQLANIKAPKINLRINSPGGYVAEGLAMYNALREHPADITATILGQAASCASWIALGADHVLIHKTANMQIHDAQGLVYGNAEDARALLDELEAESETIAAIYADRAGGDAATWRARMKANGRNGTTYHGQAAIDVGLAQGLAATAPPKPRDLADMQRRGLLNLAKLNAGRPMKQASLDKLHTAMDALDAVHSATCDMDDDCPQGMDGDNRKRNDMAEGALATGGGFAAHPDSISHVHTHADGLEHDHAHTHDDGDPDHDGDVHDHTGVGNHLPRTRAAFDALTGLQKLGIFYETTALIRRGGDVDVVVLLNAEWSTSYINDLPDSAFASIEGGGTKDAQGKTTPRSLRHYPHHDAGGALDVPHLKAALARVADPDNYQGGKAHLDAHAEAEGIGEDNDNREHFNPVAFSNMAERVFRRVLQEVSK